LEGIDLSVKSILELTRNFKRLNTHTEDDFKLIINIPAEYKNQTELFEKAFKLLEKNNIKYLLLATDNRGNQHFFCNI